MEDEEFYQEDYTYLEAGSPFEFRRPPVQPDPGSPLARFQSLALLPDEQISLAEAALIIAALQYPGLQEAFYLDRLDALADEVRPLIAVETDPLKNIESLNYFLSKLQGFHGNETEYNDRRNSYLNDVLERKTGLPITLSLLYIELGKRLGLHFEGIGLPGHFIIRYRELEPQFSGYSDAPEAALDSLDRRETPGRTGRDDLSSILLDPFNGGSVLTEEECVELVQERFGRVVPVRQAFARPVTNRQFLSRLLNNLKAVTVAEEDYEHGLLFQECLVALNPEAPDEKRDRGILYARNGLAGPSIMDLQAYLAERPDGRDAGLVGRQLKAVYDALVRRN